LTIDTLKAATLPTRAANYQTTRQEWHIHIKRVKREYLGTKVECKRCGSKELEMIGENWMKCRVCGGDEPDFVREQ